jgi:hypothetical protein
VFAGEVRGPLVRRPDPTEYDRTPENNKTRGERALLPSRSRLPYYRVWATITRVIDAAHNLTNG